MANILVTGGAGYIGSHTCKQLIQAGHRPITLDNLSRGTKSAVLWGPLEIASLAETDKVVDILKRHKVDAVIHFAAYAYVAESVKFPQMYFDNNVIGSLSLLKAMGRAGVKRLVFSSTCATYGESDGTPITEQHPQNPINPYGMTKLMIEKILLEHQTQMKLHFCALRYFNAAGADPDQEIGENHDPEPHIIPNIIRAALFKSPLTLNGNDHNTGDGTCIRDYIHVCDLADAHILAVERLLANESMAPFYNLAGNKGFSLLELIRAVENELGQKINFQWGPRRQGDPAVLIGSAERFKTDFNWQPTQSDISSLIRTATKWQRKLQSN